MPYIKKERRDHLSAWPGYIAQNAGACTLCIDASYRAFVIPKVTLLVNGCVMYGWYVMCFIIVYRLVALDS